MRVKRTAQKENEAIRTKGIMSSKRKKRMKDFKRKQLGKNGLN